MAKYTTAELMASVVSKELRDGDVCFIGIGSSGPAFIMAVAVPTVAARLAQLQHAPNLHFMFGPVIDPIIDGDFAPKSTSEYWYVNLLSAAQVPLEDTLNLFKLNKMTVGFASGAQVDKYGNCNITAIGDYEKPKVRLVGTLAQTDIACYSHRFIITVKHDKKTLVEKVDFITSAGYLDGGDSRKKAGLPGGGPSIVVSDMAVMDFHETKKTMRLRSVHPGFTVDDVIKNTGFELEIPDHVGQTPVPTELELGYIRNKIDPCGYWLKARLTGEEATLDRF